MNEKSVRDARNFSPEAYAALIESFRQRGYETRSYTDADPAKRHLIVRHDVDFSLHAAAQMAQQEALLGVASSYFVLLRTEFYNALSNEGLEQLRGIAAGRHAIGLHFDAALYPEREIEEAAARECRLLENVIERPVTVLSFHRPAPDRLNGANTFAGRINAYGPRYIREMGYCSDSRGAWRYGEPLEQPAVREGRALQLLIHSFWWTKPPLSPEERLRGFLDERAAFLDRELARHCLIHKPKN